MRMFKLALIALAALLLGGASASAITVKKRTEAPGLPPEIWAIVGDFCAIKTWHPAAADCVEEKDGDTIYRTITLKDGGKIKEKLTGKDDLSYSYEIVESPLPVKNYKSKLWLEVDDEPDRSVIYWQSDFDANGASDDDAKAKITGILADGVKGIKKQAIAAHDAKEAAAGNAPEGDKDDDDDDK
ncbi:MAG TPA: SRPBCC family protein [Methyloceanibacter sp.]|nr:SRPBCC family protein [Methyloceanibacter sp.]